MLSYGKQLGTGYEGVGGFARQSRSASPKTYQDAIDALMGASGVSRMGAVAPNTGLYNDAMDATPLAGQILNTSAPTQTPKPDDFKSAITGLTETPGAPKLQIPPDMVAYLKQMLGGAGRNYIG